MDAILQEVSQEACGLTVVQLACYSGRSHWGGYENEVAFLMGCRSSCVTNRFYCVLSICIFVKMLRLINLKACTAGEGLNLGPQLIFAPAPSKNSVLGLIPHHPGMYTSQSWTFVFSLQQHRWWGWWWNWLFVSFLTSVIISQALHLTKPNSASSPVVKALSWGLKWSGGSKTFSAQHGVESLNYSAALMVVYFFPWECCLSHKRLESCRFLCD